MSHHRSNCDPLIAKARVGRRAFSVVTLADADDAKQYWARQTPQARLRALELMRRITYGKAATGRMKKVIEIVHPDGSIQRLGRQR